MKKYNSKVLRQCKDCTFFHTGGIKDGKYDRWCCHFGKPAKYVLNHCKILNAKKHKD